MSQNRGYKVNFMMSMLSIGLLAFTKMTNALANGDSCVDETLLEPEKENIKPALQEVELKNGAVLPRAIVGATMMSLDLVIKNNPIAFYELTMKCRDESHKLFGNTGKYLQDHALLSNGQTHRSICDVVNSAVDGDGLEMSLGSPYKKARLTA